MFKKIIVLLYAIVIIVMAMATFMAQDQAQKTIYGTWWFAALWALLTACGVAYIMRRRMRRPSLLLLHGSFVVILCGALLTHITGRQSSLHLRLDVPVRYMDDGTRLPFFVTLKKFDVAYHHGTEAAADYTSVLDIYSKGMHSEAAISMNRIYSNGGVRLYQSGYDPDMQGSYISVNIDPYGIPVTYLGYAMLFIAFVWMLLDPRSGFRRAISNLKRYSVVLLLLMPGCADAATVLPDAQAEMMGKLNVLYNDRICPLQTFAYDFTKKLYGSRSYDGNSAEQVLTGFLFYPEQWNSEPFIKVKSAAVRERFGLKEYAAVKDFFPEGRGYLFTAIIEEAYRGNDDKLHQEVQKLDEKLLLIMSLQYGESTRLFPYNGKWYAPADSLPDGMEQERVRYIHQALPMMKGYAIASDWRSFSVMVQKMDKYQHIYGGESIPSQLRLQCEYIYNRIPFATILFMLCLTMGFLSLLRYRWIVITSRATIVLAWLTLTIALALRWIVSGNVPMANGYESMLLMAWIILLAAMLTMRCLSILVTFGLILSGFCLLVSHIGQMDPKISHIMPVLSSPLLSIHVSIIMMSYALLALTSLCSLWGLIVRKRAEEMMNLSIIFLYPAMTCLGIGIFVGAVWANVSWGTYWSWDPKETWALITMMLYAIPLHQASLPHFRRPAVYNAYACIAFLSVLVTYFGVNYILGGMHSYA